MVMEIIMKLLLMLGGIAVFMFGMKQMSSGMEQSAGAGVKKLFKKISNNRFAGYGVGLATTAIVQSSSATSIMTIGLANAKIVNVRQGAGIILGAKVGTTVTAFIFAMSGLSNGGLSIGTIFSAITFVGVIIIFTTHKESLKQIALFLIGFGLLFLGLRVIELALGGKDSILSQQITKLFDYEAMKNPLLLVAIGIVLTCIIQSSSAATGIFIALLSNGVISSLDQSFFLVMGANIGTCIDGIMASIGSTVYGKRIAVFHVLTSVIGAVLFTIILWIFREPIVNMFQSLIPKNEWSLAVFNLSYNIIYSLILLGLLNPLVFLVNKIVKDKHSEERKLKYIDDRLLATPSVAIDQTLKEVCEMAELAKTNLKRAFTGLITENNEDSKQIANDEYQIDFMTSELAAFIIKISSTSINYSNEKLMARLHHVISDIERIGDHAVLFAKETNSMKKAETKFLDETKDELNHIFEKLIIMYDLCIETFRTRNVKKLEEISTLHNEINQLTTEAKDVHTGRLNQGEYSVELSKSLYAALLSLQRVGDHLVNVAFSIRSNVGSKTEAFKALESEKPQK